MKVSIVSLGCSKNLVDSELILGGLQKAGHTITTENNADVIIVNTCGFISDSVKESVDTILELSEYKKKGGCKKLIVSGCLVERYAQELKAEIPEVDAFWGTGDLFRLPAALEEFSGDIGYNSPPGTIYDPDSPRILTTPPHMAYVKVSEGCSRTCSFCIIPQLRGAMKSRPVTSIVEEARMLATRGIKELNLIAQDMTSYGRDIGTSLEELLSGLAKVEGIKWVRLHYCYPWGVSDSLLELIDSEEKLLPYIDMPLQHINDRILGEMDRKTTSAQIRNILDQIRSKLTHPTLRTTFIVGFPGETEEEFCELLDFVEQTEFDRVGVFKYSHEQGTKAGLLDDSISEEEKDERYERVLETQADISFAKNKALVGSTHEGFVDSIIESAYLVRISTQAPEVDGYVHIRSGMDSERDLKVGELIDLKITGADVYDLTGEIV